MSTLYRDAIVTHLKTIHGASNALVGDITEPESLITMDGSPNHIKWLAGHLNSTNNLQLAALNTPSPTPADWDVLFKRGGMVNRDMTAYPQFAEVREKINQVNSAILDGLSKVEDTYLVTTR